MEREPIIWRPNEISPEDWGAKSRESQIAWWRENQTKNAPASKLPMSEVPQRYENGEITLSECFFLICRRATDNETLGFLNQCPDEIMAMLLEKLGQYQGADPQKWPRSFSMGSYAPWTSREEINASRELEQQLLWNGIATLKRHLENGG